MSLPDRRLVLLGDWHWLVRDPLDVLRAVFLGGTLAYAVMGRSTAVGLTAAFAVLLLARIINLPRRFDLGLIVAMTLIAWGTALSLYGEYDYYDTIVHGTTPMFYAPVLYICFVRMGVLVDPKETTTARQHAGVFVSTLAIGMAVGAGYEVVEWVSDSLVGTHFVESADDTGSDLLADTIASGVGAAFVTVWSVSGWTSRRVTYRPAAPPDVGRWIRPARSLLDRSLDRLEGSGGTSAPLVLAATGGAAVAFGVLVLAWPRLTAHTLVLLFGIYAVGYGALKLVSAVLKRRGTIAASLLLEALGSIAGGIAVLVWPRITVAVLFFVIAGTVLLAGLAGVAAASVLEIGARERALLGAAAIATVVLGVVILALPRETVLTLRWLVGAQALLVGSALVVAAWRVRQRSRRSAQSLGR
jgi:uncharacterized membrane protein HdeD (DUF308 family)